MVGHGTGGATRSHDALQLPVECGKKGRGHAHHRKSQDRAGRGVRVDGTARVTLAPCIVPWHCKPVATLRFAEAHGMRQSGVYPHPAQAHPAQRTRPVRDARLRTDRIPNKEEISMKWTTMLCAATGAIAAFAVQAQGWKPERAVEVIVGTSPGGGQDKAARTVERILSSRSLLGTSSSVVNKPGASGGIALQYLNTHPGDAHYVQVATINVLSAHIGGTVAITYTDLTPLANLYDEYVVVSVPADSPIKTGRDFIERLRRDPSSASIAIPGVAGAGHLAIGLIVQKAGIDPRKLKTVAFKSGGESIAALAGGHVDSSSSTTASPVPLAKSGKVRIIAIASPKRMPGVFADVPTWREQGVDAVWANWRGVFGPRGLTPAQAAFWEDALRKLSESEELKKDIENNMWQSNFLAGKAFTGMLKAHYDELKPLMTNLGFAKRP